MEYEWENSSWILENVVIENAFSKSNEKWFTVWSTYTSVSLTVWRVLTMWLQFWPMHVSNWNCFIPYGAIYSRRHQNYNYWTYMLPEGRVKDAQYYFMYPLRGNLQLKGIIEEPKNTITAYNVITCTCIFHTYNGTAIIQGHSHWTDSWVLQCIGMECVFEQL